MMNCLLVETDFAAKNASFENRVVEIHTWLSAGESKFKAPLKLGDAEEMDKATQRHTVCYDKSHKL